MIKKHQILGIFYFLSLAAFSQQTIPVRIVLKSTDTLIGEMKIRVNVFDTQFIYPSSFNEKVVFYNSDGMKTKIKSKEISQLDFTDLKGKSRTFVKIEGFKNHLVEVVYSNKVHWYKHYYYDSFNQIESTSEELFDENGQQYSIGVHNNYRKKMKKFTKQNVNVIEFISRYDMKKDENILKAIRMYEEVI